ncbi:glutamyl-tRNA reductase [Spirochaetia bacterium]|nr:glutamyl-tRNA reductase [Spirochaetia bacterium]
MNIYMAGIDQKRAELKEREPFAFTANSLLQALEYVGNTYPQLSCVIISTCNRTEIWLSGEVTVQPDALLCDLKGLRIEEYRSYFLCLQGKEAAAHLFRLSGGLESQIIGENQILAQVKEAWEAARRAKSIDTVLDRLFQGAVTYAKRTKTETGIMRANPSTAAAAVSCITARYARLTGLRCLVIGNGVIGRLTAEHLAHHGCDVTITLRRHKQTLSVVPQNCAIVDYDERCAVLPQFDVIISATSSPHYTLTMADLAPLWDGRERLFIDLAVPRDMESALVTLPGLELIDTDHLPSNYPVQMDSNERDKIEALVNEGLNEFLTWYEFKEHIDTIDAIREAAALDIAQRLERTLRENVPDEAARNKLEGAIVHHCEKVVGKMLFGLRDTLESDLWQPCFTALAQSSGVSSDAAELCRG